MAKLPSDRARAYDESKDPPSFKAFNQGLQRTRGPDIISPPGDYQPPGASAYKKSATNPEGYKKGGKVKPKPMGYAKGGMVKPSRGTYSK